MSTMAESKPVTDQNRPVTRGSGRVVKDFLSEHRALGGAIAFLVFMILTFTALAPGIFLSPITYTAAFTSLIPIYVIMASALVFVVVAGEIDLSFPATIGLSAYVFADSSQHVALAVAVVLALVTGALVGVVNGLLVNGLALSSLVATLGMNFLIRGLVNVLSNGEGVNLTTIQDDPVTRLLIGSWGPMPAQMIWALVFAGVAILLFSRHRFGARIRHVGDSPVTATEMGIPVITVKTLAFVYVGIAAGLTGVVASLINLQFYPNLGDGYLLACLAAVFIGGTPVWGGVGTVAGAVVGAITVGFIEPGVLASGLSGFYTSLTYGFIIVLSLVGHRIIQGTGHRK